MKPASLPAYRSVLLVLSLFALLAGLSCSAEQREAQKPVEELLKQNGARDVKLDLFFKPADMPDKAYISVTATYGFASANGQPQKEFLGYIIKKEGPKWKIDKNVSYTADKSRARDFLEGKK